jgi:hypothetical protein
MAVSTSTALVPVDPVFTDVEHLALAGFLAGVREAHLFVSDGHKATPPDPHSRSRPSPSRSRDRLPEEGPDPQRIRARAALAPCAP